MGCTISSPVLVSNFVQGSFAPENDQWHLNNNGVITFSCPLGRTLLSDGAPVLGGVFPFSCPSQGEHFPDLSFLTCSGEAVSEPSPTEPGSGGAGTPDGATTTTVVRIETAPAERVNYVECPIPSMEGVLGFHAASDVAEVSVTRYPLSVVNSSSLYLVQPLDTIIFACEDSNQILKYDGMTLEPHSVNFYGFDCKVKEDSAEQEREFNLPLTCEDPVPEAGRRNLRVGNQDVLGRARFSNVDVSPTGERN